MQVTCWQLRFLHTPSAPGGASAAPDAPAPALQPDAAISYSLECGRLRSSLGGWQANPRLVLTPGEETRALGSCRHGAPPSPAWLRLGHFKPIEVPPCDVGAHYVAGAEQRLHDLVSVPSAEVMLAQGQAGGPVPPYPLRDLHPDQGANGAGGAEPTPLELGMHRELEDSWVIHHARPAVQGVAGGAAGSIADELVRAEWFQHGLGQHPKACPVSRYSGTMCRHLLGCIGCAVWAGAHPPAVKVCPAAPNISVPKAQVLPDPHAPSPAGLHALATPEGGAVPPAQPVQHPRIRRPPRHQLPPAASGRRRALARPPGPGPGGVAAAAAAGLQPLPVAGCVRGAARGRADLAAAVCAGGPAGPAGPPGQGRGRARHRSDPGGGGQRWDVGGSAGGSREGKLETSRCGWCKGGSGAARPVKQRGRRRACSML